MGLLSHLLDSDGGGGGSAPSDNEIAYFARQAALLEPLALEPMQSGTFTYAVASNETKWVVNAWNTRLGSGGRFDVRDPREPVPLRNATLTGLSSISSAVIIDPTLPTYDDAKETYFSRMTSLAGLDTKYVPFVATDTYETLIPGPYGNLLIGFAIHDTPWLVVRGPHGSASSIGWNLSDEIGDAATDDQRVAHRLLVPVSKNTMSGISRGAAGGPDIPLAGVAYVILPSTWGSIADPNTYAFRDDFMGTTLDTTTDWTRSQSTVGNVEINTDFAACKLRGDGVWGSNGLFSKTGASAATAGLTFECDVFIGGGDGTAGANVIVGPHDGAGQSFSDFAHGLYFTASGGNRRLQVFENGTSRGLVGATQGWTALCLYRVRITLDGAGAATYEIQGGTEHPAIGGATWTNVTPATTSSATATVHAGASAEQAHDHYISDPKLYT